MDRNSGFWAMPVLQFLASEPYKQLLKGNFKNSTNCDFNFCISRENKVGKSRALDNLGRVHAKLGDYGKAIDQWMEKMPLVKSPLEGTWLYHEIGRCHLELKNFQDAKEYGQKSLAAAQEADDQVWQLNATVLIAQAEGKQIDIIITND